MAFVIRAWVNITFDLRRSYVNVNESSAIVKNYCKLMLSRSAGCCRLRKICLLGARACTLIRL